MPEPPDVIVLVLTVEDQNMLQHSPFECAGLAMIIFVFTVGNGGIYI